MKTKPPILIITGYGLNCEAESAHAWTLAGAAPVRLHLNDLIAAPRKLADFAGLMFIGGFSYGDHMGSGHVFAHRLRHRLQEPLARFVADGKLILGVCNGFQIMTKLGLVPGLDGDYFSQTVALTHNDCGAFQNFWVDLMFEPGSPCVFTRNLRRMPMPIRHGEGKLYVGDAALLEKLEQLKCVPCRYAHPATGAPTMDFPHNPNGSVNSIAGLCDPTGRIFGLMPHPEAYLFPENHPRWDINKLAAPLPEQGLGLALFTNAVSYLQQ